MKLAPLLILLLRNLGPQDFAISASAGTPSVSTLHLEPNTTASISVAAPPGPVTLTASTGAVSRQATTTVTAPPPAARPPEITATITGKWSRTKTGVRIRTLRLAGLPEGARVDVVCTPCHVTHAATLAKLRNRVLKRGQSFTVTVTKPGSIGERVTMTVKRGGFTSRRVLIPSG